MLFGVFIREKLPKNCAKTKRQRRICKNSTLPAALPLYFSKGKIKLSSWKKLFVYFHNVNG